MLILRTALLNNKSAVQRVQNEHGDNAKLECGTYPRMRHKTKTGGGGGTNQYHVQGRSKTDTGLTAPVLSVSVGLLDPPVQLPASLAGACVSEHTLKNSDLAPKFIDCLSTSNERLGHLRYKEYEELSGGDDYAADYGPAAETISELVCQLIDDLDAIAPDGCYFGAHEGDPASYGFWALHD